MIRPRAGPARAALALVLFSSWLVLLPFLWRAFATVPSAERLARSHMAQIPTLTTLWQQLGLSALEMAVLLLLIWPGSARHYLARLWTAALVTPVYFIATTPLSLTTLQWTHRRWLAAVSLGLLLAALVASGMRLLRSRGTSL